MATKYSDIDDQPTKVKQLNLDRWSSFLKFLLGTVLVGIISLWINKQIQDRQTESQLLQFQSEQVSNYLFKYVDGGTKEKLEFANFMRFAAIREEQRKQFDRLYSNLDSTQQSLQSKLQTADSTKLATSNRIDRLRFQIDSLLLSSNKELKLRTALQEALDLSKSKYDEVRQERQSLLREISARDDLSRSWADHADSSFVRKAVTVKQRRLTLDQNHWLDVGVHRIKLIDHDLSDEYLLFQVMTFSPEGSYRIFNIPVPTDDKMQGAMSYMGPLGKATVLYRIKLNDYLPGPQRAYVEYSVSML